MRRKKQQTIQALYLTLYGAYQRRQKLWMLIRLLSILWLGAGVYNYVRIFPDQFPDPMRRALVAFGFGLIGLLLPTITLPKWITLDMIEIASRGATGGLLLLFLALTQRRDARMDIEERACVHAETQGRVPPRQIIRELSFKGAGVPVAEIHGRVVGIPYGADSGHAAVIAPTRSGKGLHLTETLLCWPGAAVVVDPKAEQWERTAGWRQQHAGPVYQIPPAGIDVLSTFDLGDPLDLQELHRHIMRPWEGKETIFAEKTLPLFHAAASVAEATHGHMLRVLAQWTKQPAPAVFQAAHVHAREAIDVFLDGDEPARPNRFTLSAWGTFTTRFLPLVPHIHTITTATVPADWAEQKATIYICYPMHQLKTATALVSTLVAALIKGQMKQHTKRQTLVAIDEMPTVGLYNLAEYLATVGGYGITLLSYAQALTQIEETYGKAQAQAILANCHHQLFYPPRDNETALYVSRAFGTALYAAESTTWTRRGMSTAIREAQRPALEPAQVLALPETAVLVFSNLAGRQYRFLGERVNPIPRLAKLPTAPVPTGAARVVDLKPLPAPTAHQPPSQAAAVARPAVTHAQNSPANSAAASHANPPTHTVTSKRSRGSAVVPAVDQLTLAFDDPSTSMPASNSSSAPAATPPKGQAPQTSEPDQPLTWVSSAMTPLP
jgi:hypothetical protein